MGRVGCSANRSLASEASCTGSPESHGAAHSSSCMLCPAFAVLLPIVELVKSRSIAGVLGTVSGLQVLQSDGSVEGAAVVGMAAPSETRVQAEAIPAAGWGDVSMQLLLRYADGRQEWLDLCVEQDRERLQEHVWRYHSTCACDMCVQVAARPPVQQDGERPRGLSV